MAAVAIAALPLVGWALGGYAYMNEVLTSRQARPTLDTVTRAQAQFAEDQATLPGMIHGGAGDDESLKPQLVGMSVAPGFEDGIDDYTPVRNIQQAIDANVRARNFGATPTAPISFSKDMQRRRQPFNIQVFDWIDWDAADKWHLENRIYPPEESQAHQSGSFVWLADPRNAKKGYIRSLPRIKPEPFLRV